MKIQTRTLVLLLFFEILHLGLYSQESADLSLETEPAVAAEEEAEVQKPAFSLSGSADVYFRSNLTAKNDLAISAPAPNTAFAYSPGFGIGMFNLIGAYEGSRAGVVGDLVFGPRGVDAVFASGAPNNIVNQLYVYWKATDKLTLTMGDFNTFLGYEVISPTGNFNYSTSYMFSWGPFSHTGLKADFAVNDDLSFMIGVFNPTDFTEFNPVGTYSLGGQIGYKGVYLNLLYGDQDGRLSEDAEDGMVSAGALFQIDLTAGWDLTESFYLGLNTTYNATAMGEHVEQGEVIDDEGDASSFYGAAAYLQYRTSETFALGLRGEYFAEANGGYGIIGSYDADDTASILALTLSGNITIGNLTLIPEIRMDT
ncbi:MAG: porin, partial [Mameliella sp.]|nr:porin [Phaeodactylibacter sp.]